MARKAKQDEPKPERESERRQQILSQATELFRTQGYDATGIREIADSAQVQTSTLYHYFSNKQAILFAVLKQINDDANAVVLPILHGAGTPTDRLARVVIAHIAISDPSGFQAMNFGRVFRRALSDTDADFIADQHYQYLEGLRALLSEGVESGEFEIDDVNVTSRAILDMINGQRDWFQPNGRLSRAELAHLYTNMALRLCGARTASATEAAAGATRQRRA